MAVDKLVDSTQLDADLTSVANAIRAKSGGSNQLAFPSGFVSEIGNIPSGGTLVTKTITANGTYAAEDDDADGYSEVTVDVPGLDLSAVNKVNFGINGATITSDNVVFDLSGKTVVLAQTQPFKATATTDPTTITIKCKNFSAAVANLAQGASKIRTFIFDTEENPVPGSQMLKDTGFYRVLGTPIKLASFGGTGQYNFIRSTTLQEIYLVPNECAAGGNINTGVLIDASVVSIANALKAVTGQTINFQNATTKAKCSTIIGTVSTVGEGDDAYDFFTQDPNGTVTLAEFITNVKGWTLA